MMASHMNQGRRMNRRGASAVEAVLVAPILVLVLLGAIDIGQYVNVAQTISNASRESARFACRQDTTTVASVKAHIQDYLQSAFPGMSGKSIQEAFTVTIRDESGDGAVITSDLSTIESGSTMSVKVDFDFDTVRWLKNIDYWELDHNGTTTFVRRE